MGYPRRAAPTSQHTLRTIRSLPTEELIRRADNINAAWHRAARDNSTPRSFLTGLARDEGAHRAEITRRGKS